MLLGQNVVGLEVRIDLSTNNERYEFVEDWKVSMIIGLLFVESCGVFFLGKG